MHTVSFRFLLSLYAIVPVALLVAVVDRVYLTHGLRDALPATPSQFVLLQVLFGTPHILASNMLLAWHREYLGAYWKQLALMTLFIVAFFGLGSLLLPYNALYAITATWTVYHVLKQQLGIAKPMCKLPALWFRIHLVLTVFTGALLYLGIFLDHAMSPELLAQGKRATAAGVATLVVFTAIAHRVAQPKMGRAFLWANTLLVVGSYGLYTMGYSFLAILCPRLVHDITAYSFYVTHDRNRHGRETDHPVYGAFRRLGIPALLVLPVLSILAAFVLQNYGDGAVNAVTHALLGTEVHRAVTLGLIGYFSLMHYFTESFIWTAGSPLRRHIAFSR